MICFYATIILSDSVSQLSALCVMQPEGLSQVADLVSFYKENANILRQVFSYPMSTMQFLSKASLYHFATFLDPFIPSLH